LKQAENLFSPFLSSAVGTEVSLQVGHYIIAPAIKDLPLEDNVKYELVVFCDQKEVAFSELKEGQHVSIKVSQA
jgi:hypothetical protein